MAAFTHHIFICCNQRSPDHRRGCCDPEGNNQLRNAFKDEVKRRNLGPLVRANQAGCLEQCEHGPPVAVCLASGIQRNPDHPVTTPAAAGTIRLCRPAVAIYPQGIFYGGVTLNDVPRIVEETVIGGRILEDLLIADSCLNNPNCEHIQPDTLS